LPDTLVPREVAVAKNRPWAGACWCLHSGTLRPHTPPWLGGTRSRGGHQRLSRPLPVTTETGHDSPSVFVLVTEGESWLFPATFIYHFTPVSMETSHDIAGCSRGVGRSAELLGASGTEQNKC